MTAPAAAWHDVEHGAYDADLPLWRELAEAAAGGPVLDLGAGTGRVAVDLAAHGHEVVALDSDPALLSVLADRAPGVTTVTGDARDFDLGASFPLVLAPMQLIQIIGGRDGRAAMLERVHSHLEPDGTFAAALADPHEAATGEHTEPPLPDMLERDGWVFSSLPVAIEERNGRVVVTRRRLSVSPAGALEEEMAEIAFDLVSADEFEEEARTARLTPADRRTVAETPDHIGSTVVVCRR
ncbi:MAG TPA: class I SAM-dependent methyltransferase [Thermoleophilaceae bacterium]|nr:class I SAM-dependent methyltransferase [Thermoleophilaceae bacterium]